MALTTVAARDSLLWAVPGFVGSRTLTTTSLPATRRLGMPPLATLIALLNLQALRE